MGILDRFNQGKKANLSEKVIYSPASGRIVPLESVSDPLFSNKIMGDGVAIEPTQGIIVAPCSGEVKMVFDSKHAILFYTNEGIKLLIHIGIDTVALCGKYYESKCKVGDHVAIGQELMKFDIKRIKEAGYEVTCPVIISNMSDFEKIELLTTEGEVNQLDSIIKVYS